MDSPEEPDFEAASASLKDGLRNCRAVLSGYRALLVTDPDTEPLVEEEAPRVDHAGGGAAAA